MERVCSILENENIEYEKKVIAEVIQTHFPDWRRVLNELQRYSVSGMIDAGILVNISEVNIRELMHSMKNKEFTNVRKWVVDNLDNDPVRLLRSIYDGCYTTMEGSGIAAAVLIIARYSYQIAFVADQEINLLAALTEIMVECEFK